MYKPQGEVHYLLHSKHHYTNTAFKHKHSTEILLYNRDIQLYPIWDRNREMTPLCEDTALALVKYQQNNHFTLRASSGRR